MTMKTKKKSLPFPSLTFRTSMSQESLPHAVPVLFVCLFILKKRETKRELIKEPRVLLDLTGNAKYSCGYDTIFY